MIVYPRNTVTYLRNNQAVSWPGFEPATASHKSNVLTITPPSHPSSNWLNNITIWMEMNLEWLLWATENRELNGEWYFIVWLFLFVFSEITTVSLPRVHSGGSSWCKTWLVLLYRSFDSILSTRVLYVHRDYHAYSGFIIFVHCA